MITALQNVILWSASRGGQEEVARTALDNGADPNASKHEAFGMPNPLHATAENGYEEVVRLLLANGANAAGSPLCRLQPLIHAVRGGWLRVAQ
jgi:ankyrin repeat protein